MLPVQVREAELDRERERLWLPCQSGLFDVEPRRWCQLILPFGSPHGTQPGAASLDPSPSWVRGTSSGRAPWSVLVLFCVCAWIRPSSIGSDGVPSPGIVMWVQVWQVQATKTARVPCRRFPRELGLGLVGLVRTRRPRRMVSGHGSWIAQLQRVVSPN